MWCRRHEDVKECRMSPVAVFASFTPADGKEQDVLGVLERMVEHTRQEPGNDLYSLYRADGEDGTTFHIFERYRDQDALDAHRSADYYKDYRATIPSLLAQPIGVLVLAEVDVQQ
jgi:quinol monooxygenase YgiN